MWTVNIYIRIVSFAGRAGSLGNQYTVGSAILGIYGAVMTFRALINVWINYYLAQNQNSFLYILALGVIVQLVLLNFYHTNFTQIVVVQAFTTGMVSMAGFVLFHYASKTKLTATNP